MDMTPTPFQALQRAVEAVGSQSEFARLLGVSQTAVWKWLQSSKRLPAEHVLTVEQATGVYRHWLRPDIYPVEPRFHGVDRRADRVSFNSRAVSKRAPQTAR